MPLAAHEHPDTAEFTGDVRLARFAATLALLAFGLPYLLAALR